MKTIISIIKIITLIIILVIDLFFLSALDSLAEFDGGLFFVSCLVIILLNVLSFSFIGKDLEKVANFFNKLF